MRKEYFPINEIDNFPKSKDYKIILGKDFENNGFRKVSDEPVTKVYNNLISKPVDWIAYGISKMVSPKWTVQGYCPDNLKKNVMAFQPHVNGHKEFSIGIPAHRKLHLPKPTVIQKRENQSLWYMPKSLSSIYIKEGAGSTVFQAAEFIKESDEITLAISPEGTLKDVDRLRKGFYYMALTGGVPITFLTFHHDKKIVNFSEPFYPSDKAKEDFEVKPYAISDNIQKDFDKINEYLIKSFTTTLKY